MNLKIKPLHPNFIAPRYATAGSAVLDLHAVKVGQYGPSGTPTLIPLGFAVEVPEGFVMLIFGRKLPGLRMGAGVPHGAERIDSTHRGEVDLVLHSDYPMSWGVGDRIAQAIVVPVVHCRFDIVEELNETTRGTGSGA